MTRWARWWRPARRAASPASLSPTPPSPGRRRCAAGTAVLISPTPPTARPETLRGRHRAEAGGLSGPPLFARSTEMLRQAYRLSRGRLAPVGVGGACGGAEAYAKIRAGASLVQLYAGFAYDGPALIPRIKAELAALLRRDGFARVADAVGVDA